MGMIKVRVQGYKLVLGIVKRFFRLWINGLLFQFRLVVKIKINFVLYGKLVIIGYF